MSEHKIRTNAAVNYFYVAPKTAEIQIISEIQRDDIQQPHLFSIGYSVQVSISGGIYEGEKIVAHFSDNYDAINAGRDVDYAPLHYANELNLPPGDYVLKLALSDGSKYGVTQESFHVDYYDGKALGVSSLALCGFVRKVEDMRADIPQLPVVKPSPLISEGVQFIPTANKLFEKKSPLYFYFELYEPLLQKTVVPTVKYHMRILGVKDGAIKMDSGMLDAAKYFQKDSIVIPIGEKLNLEKLTKGCYRLEVQAADSAGQSTPVRSEQFCVK